MSEPAESMPAELMSVEIDLAPYSVRSFRPGDEPTLQRAADDWQVARWLRDAFPHPYTIADARDWVAYASTVEPQTELAIVDRRAVVGSVGFKLQDDMQRRSAEVGYWVASSHWGRGIATRALAALVRHAFDGFDLIRLFAGVKEGNVASAKVLAANGFELEGRLRKAITGRSGEEKDELMYGLLLDDYREARKGD